MSESRRLNLVTPENATKYGIVRLPENPGYIGQPGLPNAMSYRCGGCDKVLLTDVPLGGFPFASYVQCPCGALNEPPIQGH